MRPYDLSSLNDCNEGKRQSDVLIATIEKCEKLEKDKELSDKNAKLWFEQAEEKAKENAQLKEEIKKLKEVIYDLDGLECPKCGNYHRRGWTCSNCGYGK